MHDWRFRLSEEEDRRRRKFGWDDLFDLLQTAAGGYAAVKGVQEAGKRTALAEEKFGYEQEQDVLRETARQGTAMRGMEEAGYERVPTLTGGYGDAAKAAQMGGDMGRVHPDLGDTAWRQPPEVDPMDKTLEDRERLFEFLSGQLGEGQTLLPTTTGYRADWMPGYGQEPDIPSPMSDRDRMGAIERGWSPESQATAYDLDTQMPLVDGQPRPVVGGLVAPPIPESEEAPAFSESELLRAIGLTKSPVEAMTIPDFYSARQDLSNIMAGGVPWDEDEVPSIIADQQSARPMMTPAEIVADADKAYGLGWGDVLWRMVEPYVPERE